MTELGYLDTTIDTLVTDNPTLAGLLGDVGEVGEPGIVGSAGLQGDRGPSGSSSEDLYSQSVFEDILKNPPSIDIAFNNGIFQSSTGPLPSFNRNTSGLFLNSDGILVGKTTSSTSLNLSTIVAGNTISVVIPSRSAVDWQINSKVVLLSDTDADNTIDAGESYVSCLLTDYNISTSTLTLSVVEKSGSSTISSWVVSYCGPRCQYEFTNIREKNILLGTQNFTSWLINEGDGDGAISPFGTNPNTSSIHNAISSPHSIFSFNGTKITEIASTTPGYNIVRQICYFEPNTTYTFSVYAKYGNLQYLSLYAFLSSTVEMSASFDLQNGTVGTAFRTGVTRVIENVGDDWYRCSITFKTPSNPVWNFVDIRLHDDDALNTTITTRNSRYSYIFGAQVEIGSLPTSYERVRTIYPQYPQIITSKGLVIEESRTNLLTYNSTFSDSSWSKTGTTITPNSTTAPDGTTNASLILETATTAMHHISKSSITIPAGANITYSICVKPYDKSLAYGRKNIKLICDNGVGNGFIANFDILNGKVNTIGVNGLGTGTAHIENYNNGWYRCSISGIISPTDTSCRVSTILTQTTTSDWYNSYAGDAGDGVYIWGAQLEVGSTPTSIIPTTTSAAIRTADDTGYDSSQLLNVWNKTQGTIFCEFSSLGRSAMSAYLDNSFVFQGATNSNNRLGAFIDASGALDVEMQTGAVDQYIGSRQLINNSSSRKQSVAFSFKNGQIAKAYSSGITLPTTIAIASTIPQITSLSLGKSESSTNYLNGTLQTFRYYNTALSENTLKFLSYGYEASYIDDIATQYSNAINAILQTSQSTTNEVLTPHQRDAINRFVVSGKIHGWYYKMRHIYLPIWQNADANALNLCDLTSGTFTGTLTHALGYSAGDGASGRFDYSASPSNVGLSTTDGSLFFLLADTTTALNDMGASATIMGASDSGSTNPVSVYRTGITLSYTYGGTTPTTISYAAGAHLIKRQPINNVVYQSYTAAGEAIMAGPTAASSGISTSNMSAWAINTAGTYSNYGQYRIGAHGVGLGLSNEEGSYFIRDIKTLWETCTGLTI